jgi:nucleoside phosphorylase
MTEQQKTNLESGPVDFAIVTALDIECKAVLEHLGEKNYKKIQEEGKRTYYRSHIIIPERDEYYEIVVALQLDMGNNNAQSTANQIIERWKPSNIIMLGIAGGVPNKVALGDVVVAKFCWYYELAKNTKKGEQRRIRQFDSNEILHDRALHLPNKWTEEIGLAPPECQKKYKWFSELFGVNHPKVLNLPKKHIGTIGSGEKVIADKKILQKLLKDCSELMAVAMEGAGVAEAAKAKGLGFIEIRGISDFADPKKNDDWHSYAANAAAAFIIELLRSQPFAPLSSEKNNPSISKIPTN